MRSTRRVPPLSPREGSPADAGGVRSGLIIFDLAYELTLGGLCAALSRGRPAAFKDGLLLSSAIYIPLCGVGLSGWPAWQSMYLFDTSRIGALPAVAAQSAALLLAYLAGFSLGRWALLAGRGLRLSAAAAAGWALLLPALFGLMRRRALTVTSYQAFYAGAEEPAWGAADALLGGPVMYFLLASAALNLLGLSLVLARAAGGPR